MRARQRKAVDFLRDLRRVPCTDCRSEFPAFVMDFDHRESGRKAFWVLQRAGSVSHDRLMAELEKCDIVCANCHRARTHARALERRRVRIASGQVPITESRLRHDQTELLRQLRDIPCADCLQHFPFFAMDFDHRNPIDKAFEVTRMLGRVDTEKLLAEVGKCDIVCANCHRERTYRRRTASAGVA